MTVLSTLLQNLISSASQPHPGLAAGALVNSTVYILGLQILLKGQTAVNLHVMPANVDCQ